MIIPQEGVSRDTLLETLKSFQGDDLPWRNGRTWAYVYDPGGEAEEVIKAAYMMYLSENALDPTAFPSAVRLENDVVSMAAHHLNGDEHVVGNFTSGGTESIILAVKAARDFAKDKRDRSGRGQIILPVTAHAAFHKAAHYLELDKVIVPVDPETFRADVDEMRSAITEDTILLVGSAVSYAHGVVDPIAEIGQLAIEHDLLFHVDACMGGFLLPYFRRLGADVPPFDFGVPGVTSISMDLHKYAFAAKGASTILYRDKALRKYQIYTCGHWTGYSVVNPTIQSSKTAGPLAAAWAVLNFIGEAGYLALARTMFDGTQRILQAIESHPDLRVLGRPDMNLIAFTSDTVDIFHVVDEMTARGWYIQPQLGYGDSKANVHLSVNPNSHQWVSALIDDLAVCVEAARSIPVGGGLAGALSDVLTRVDTATVDDSMLDQMLGMAGVTGVDLPKRMAEVNQVLDALPKPLCERLLTHYMNELYRPPPRSTSGE